MFVVIISSLYWLYLFAITYTTNTGKFQAKGICIWEPGLKPLDVCVYKAETDPDILGMTFWIW